MTSVNITFRNLSILGIICLTPASIIPPFRAARWSNRRIPVTAHFPRRPTEHFERILRGAAGRTFLTGPVVVRAPFPTRIRGTFGGALRS
jgi:hypothetical protein